MKHKFGKVLLSLLCLGGLFAFTGCQSAGHDAKVPVDQCEVRIYRQAGDVNKTGVVTLGIQNNTIYNIRGIKLTYNVYEDITLPDPVPVVKDAEAVVDIGIRHGVTGYLSYTVKVTPQDDPTDVCNYAKITKAEVVQYASLWETYLVPFVLMFVAVGIALVFFGVEIFGKGLTREDVKQAFKERLASSLFILGLILLLCLVPLMFSSWVVTVILVGGYAAAVLLTGVMTLIKMAVTK